MDIADATATLRTTFNPAKSLRILASGFHADVTQPFLQSEPYTDANSNGKWDTGESYTDYNSNSTYDKASCDKFFDFDKTR